MTIFDNRLARLARLVVSSETIAGKTAPALQWRRRSSLSRIVEATRPLLRRPGFLLAVAIVAFALLAALVQAALLAVGIAMAGGLSLGVISGFAGGRIDAVIMRLIDVLLALPGLLLALAIVTAIGFGTLPVAIAVGVGIIPGFARTTRAEVLRVKTLPYVEAARLGGASWTRTLLRHILPNAWGPVAVLATLDFGAAILATAGLSFLGFGAEPP
ncbi:ABC transporter permease, partial [Pseudomonas syringae pv. syringae]